MYGEGIELGGRRIVVADDEPAQRLLMEAALSQAGFVVRTVEDGQQALEILRSFNADLVILDVDMPQRDGVATCRAIRECAKSRHLPVIIATALEDDVSVRTAFDVGATDFVNKPINWPAFVHHVRHVLRAHLIYADLISTKSQNLTLVEAVPDSIVRVDREGVIVEQLSRARGLSHSAGDRLHQVMPLDQARRIESMVRTVLDRGTPRNSSVTTTGEPLTVFEIRLLPHDEQTALLILRDISERKRAEASLKRLEEFDPVTGLANRGYFSARLKLAVRRCRRHARSMSVLAINLDRFERVNDTLGREAGDHVLRETAQRLEFWSSAHCTSALQTNEVAHLGGDRFAVMLVGTADRESIESALSQLRTTLGQSIRWQSHEFAFTFSAGVARIPADGVEAEAILRRAESACAQAKRDEQTTFHFHSNQLDRTAFDRLELERDLRRALDVGDIFLAYQPKIELATGRCVGVEALARWTCAKRGAVGPGEFIPLAEELGLSDRLASYVLRRACEQAVTWRENHGVSISVAVNLSSRQFQRPDIVDEIRQVIAESGIQPASLEIELTESTLMREGRDPVQLLHALKDLGVTLAVDDFGTGYSSLAYLKRFALDCLKVDQSFVADLDRDEDSYSIVSAVVALAHSLNLRVVAEGIETEAQLAVLKDLGCDLGQGFLFGRPSAAENIPEHFGSERPRAGNQKRHLLEATVDMP